VTVFVHEGAVLVAALLLLLSAFAASTYNTDCSLSHTRVPSSASMTSYFQWMQGKLAAGISRHYSCRASVGPSDLALLPVYNEEERISPLHEIFEELTIYWTNPDMFFVDDGTRPEHLKCWKGFAGRIAG
jgi:hypothetical protein